MTTLDDAAERRKFTFTSDAAPGHVVEVTCTTSDPHPSITVTDVQGNAWVRQLDDAAEQGIRNVAEALRTSLNLNAAQMNMIVTALWAVHDKATEAAAKKCDAIADECHDCCACDKCAPALRGNK